MAALHACVVVALGMCACACLPPVAAYYDAQMTPSLQQVPGVSSPDEETSYLIPRLAHKYRPQTGEWFDVSDPRLYLLTENNNEESQQEGGGGRRQKRTGLEGGPSLSIVNPLEVLRQRLLLEIARRRMRQSEKTILENRVFLKSIGKRSVAQQVPNSKYEMPTDRLESADVADGSARDGGASRWSSDS